MRAIDVQGLGKTDRVNYDIILFTDRNGRVSPARASYLYARIREDRQGEL